jgi:hypothetical protein
MSITYLLHFEKEVNNIKKNRIQYSSRKRKPEAAGGAGGLTEGGPVEDAAIDGHVGTVEDSTPAAAVPLLKITKRHYFFEGCGSGYGKDPYSSSGRIRIHVLYMDSNTSVKSPS